MRSFFLSSPLLENLNRTSGCLSCKNRHLWHRHHAAKKGGGSLSFCGAFFPAPSVPDPPNRAYANHKPFFLTGAPWPAIIRAQLRPQHHSLVRRPEKRPELWHDRPRTGKLQPSVVGGQRTSVTTICSLVRTQRSTLKCSRTRRFLHT